MNKESFTYYLKILLEENITPFIEVKEVYDLSPKAIRNLRCSDVGVQFTYTNKGIKMDVSIPYKNILTIGTRPVNIKG